MVTLSDLASRKLSELISAQGEKVIGLRLHAMSGCCSGPSFGMSLADQAMPGDWEGEISGVRVVVDPESLPLLEGANIDFVETPEQSGFTIANPNAAKTGGGCGCGSGRAQAETEGQTHGAGGGCGCGSH